MVGRLLTLLAEFGVSATWCIVGHLLLSACSRQHGVKHPEIVRPAHSWAQGDWFEHDPCGSEEADGIFYGASLVEEVRSCRVRQEIGCHSFSHVIFGDAGCSRETAASELAECVRLASQAGIGLQSFAFPRNSIGHLDVLRDYGFTSYRGPEPVWYERAGMPSLVKRLAHLADVLSARRPPIVMPQESVDGVWNIPGSMLFFPMHGGRRHIPPSVRVRRAIKGVERAADDRGIFHLWLHPTNLADQPEKMFGALATVFERVAQLREQGRLDVLPMASVAAEAGRALSAHGQPTGGHS